MSGAFFVWGRGGGGGGERGHRGCAIVMTASRGQAPARQAAIPAHWTETDGDVAAGDGGGGWWLYVQIRGIGGFLCELGGMGPRRHRPS